VTARAPLLSGSRRRGFGPAEVLVFLCFALAQFSGRLVRHLLMKEEWFVALRLREQDDASGAVRVPASPPFRRLEAGRSVYLADPWLVSTGDRTYLFAESFDYAAERGSIVVADVSAGGAVSRMRSALERPYHLSYPCVFEFRGERYMIPESSANRTLELYRALDFPDQWVLDTVLFEDVQAVDPTVLEHEGRLWLFVSMADNADMSKNEELFLFFADSPAGPWTPHPANPVVADVRCARPAGPIFSRGGRLIRPAQDCLRGYGHAVSLRCIDRLSTDEYEEHEVGRIVAAEVGAGGTDVHTYSHAGMLEVIDVRRFRLRV
jgi:hypothetical protein